jgi:cardiolipin synthase
LTVLMLTTLPNLLTLSRIAVIPLFIGAFLMPGDFGNWASFALFLAAGITDYFDGWFARRWQQISAFGRFLDPIADKLLVASAILMLVSADRVHLFPALVILCREILVSGLREFLAQLRVGMPVSRLAKWKTGIQIAAISFLLVGEAGPTLLAPYLTVDLIGGALVWIAAILTIATGYDYMRLGLLHMDQSAPPTEHRAEDRGPPAARAKAASGPA